VLESEFFTDNQRFLDRGKLQPDPQMKQRFEKEVAEANRLADSSLHTNASDTNALFAKSLATGLRADSASLLEKHDLAALKLTKEARTYGEQLLTINPKDYDAYLGCGVESYLLSLKPAPIRFVLRLTGSIVDREKGIEQMRLTAQHGHFLEPFAKLLLALAALRDNDHNRARTLLTELHDRFPDNPLYLRELDRLKTASN
jgi:tetratricopeptide (TPR) repeat protein